MNPVNHRLTPALGGIGTHKGSYGEILRRDLTTIDLVPIEQTRTKREWTFLVCHFIFLDMINRWDQYARVTARATTRPLLDYQAIARPSPGHQQATSEQRSAHSLAHI